MVFFRKFDVLGLKVWSSRGIYGGEKSYEVYETKEFVCGEREC